MKTLKSILASLFTIVMFASCTSSDDPEMVIEQTYYPSVNYVCNLNTGVVKTYEKPTYLIKLDYVAKTASVKIGNAQFADMMPAIDMYIENLKWKYDTTNSYIVIDATDVVPVVNGQSMPEYTITSLKVNVLDRYVNNEYEPVINVQFEINNMFRVTAMPPYVLYVGSTGIVDPEAGTNYINSEMLYKVKIDYKKMKANVVISGAKFAPSMPAMNMEFAGVDVKLSEKGFVLTSQSLIPTIANTPYPKYEITNLSGDATFASGMNLVFTCASKYSVTANLGYLSK